MTFNEAKFLLSAPKLEHCPPPDFPEICFAGRSNVGKSSLINALTNHKKLAKTSNVPGKTQEMNYYLIRNKWYLVDLPGYGFAKVSKRERNRWINEVQNYLLNRQNLNIVALIVDLRHPPGNLDQEFMSWLAENEIPFCVLASKADKLSANQRSKSMKILKNTLKNLNIEVPVTAYSAESKDGIEQVQELLEDFFTHPIKPETDSLNSNLS